MSKKSFILLSVIILAVFLVRGINGSYQPEDNCQGLSSEERPLCLKKEFEAVLQSKGVTDGFNLLTFLYKSDNLFPPICHDYMHLIGEEAYKRYAKGERFKLTDTAGSCGYGFYHGFIVALFKDGKGKNEASEFCDWANKSVSSQVSTITLDCFHGIGHGMIDFDIGDAKAGNTQRIVDESLKICGEVGGNKRETQRCINGVYHSSIGFMFASDGFNVFSFCKNQPEAEAASCFSASSFFVTENNQGDFLKSALVTQNSLDMVDAATVIRGMAGYIAYRDINSSGKIRDNIKVCQSLKLTLKEECIKGLVEGITDFGVPGEEEKGIKTFCEDGQFDQKEKTLCLSHAASYFGDYFGLDKKQKLCGLIGSEYCIQ